MMDISRIDNAVHDGTLADERRPRRRHRQGQGAPAARLHLLGLVQRRRRPLLARAPLRAHRRRARARACPSSSTRSSTGATCSRGRRPGTSPSVEKHARAARRVDRHRRRVATGRWTATTAGSASSAPTTPSSTRDGAAGDDRAREGVEAQLRRRQDRRVRRAVRRRRLRRRRRRQTRRSTSTSAPTARASSRAPSRIAGVRRLRARGGSAPFAGRYACMTTYDATLRPPDRLPEGDATRTSSPRSSRAPGSSSSAAPRPRSTRT